MTRNLDAKYYGSGVCDLSLRSPCLLKENIKTRQKETLIYSFVLPFSAGTNTAAATVVVQSPFLSPAADWVMLAVLMINPVVLKSCLRSSHAVSGSNWMPMVVASIVAPRSYA